MSSIDPGARPRPAAHPSMRQFAVAGGELVIGGPPRSRLGRTPLYAYERGEYVVELRAALAASLQHHVSASGNFGQVVRKNYPVAIGNRMGATQQERASVEVPPCTPLDLVDRIDLAAADVGDFSIFQSGACGASASPQAVLGHPACVEALV